MPLWTLWHNKHIGRASRIETGARKPLAALCIASAAINHNENSFFPLLFHSFWTFFFLFFCFISFEFGAAIESINSNYFSYFNVNNNSSTNQIIAGNNNGGNANNQWSVWQQFQWPYVQPEQNRWSKSHGVRVCFVFVFVCVCARDPCGQCAPYVGHCLLLACILFKFIYCFFVTECSVHSKRPFVLCSSPFRFSFWFAWFSHSPCASNGENFPHCFIFCARSSSFQLDFAWM